LLGDGHGALTMRRYVRAPGRVRLVREPLTDAVRAALRERPQVHCADDAARLLWPLAEVEEQEVVWTLLLNTQYQVLDIAEVTRGTVTESLVHPREVFRPAIARGATALILAHNHPSGDPSPSQPDHLTTRRIREVGRLIDIELLDHVVLGLRPRYYSFAQEGDL
jgi:DNA repair protein RadC